jgi:hypothetical protein
MALTNMGGPPPQASPRGPTPAMGGPPPGGSVQSKMSMFNPTDLAAKQATGAIRLDMSVGEFLQKNFGVRPEDPVQKLFEATKGQMRNRDMAGKMGVPPQGQPPRPPQAPPGGAPPPPGAPPQGGGRPPARGLDDLVRRI